MEGNRPSEKLYIETFFIEAVIDCSDVGPQTNF